MAVLQDDYIEASWKVFKDTLKAFNDFRSKQQKRMRQYFLICKSMYKSNGTKNTLFLASSNSSQFTFNLRFLYELKYKVSLSKTVCGIFHFRFRFDFIKVCIFVQQNTWTLWLYNVITSFKIKRIKKHW